MQDNRNTFVKTQSTAVDAGPGLHRVTEVPQPRDVPADGALGDVQAKRQLGRRPGRPGLEQSQQPQQPAGRLEHNGILRQNQDRTCPHWVIVSPA